MEAGDTVKFVDGLYEDDEKARYKVVEIEGDWALIEYLCDWPIPPQSTAKLSELEVVDE